MTQEPLIISTHNQVRHLFRIMKVNLIKNRILGRFRFILPPEGYVIFQGMLIDKQTADAINALSGKKV